MARTDDQWEPGDDDTYIKTTKDVGYNVLLNGTNKYLNFNNLSGSSGYGFRDNSGTMEFKNSGGSWGSMVGYVSAYSNTTYTPVQTQNYTSGYFHGILKVNNKFFMGGRDGKLTVINAPDTDLTNVTYVVVAGSGYLDNMVYDRVRDKIYCCLFTSSASSIISFSPSNPAGWSTVFTTPALGGSPGMAITSDCAYLYVGTYLNPATIQKISIATWTISTSATWTGGVGCHSMQIAPDDSYIMVTSVNGRVAKFDTATLTPTTVDFVPIIGAGVVFTDDSVLFEGYYYAGIEGYNKAVRVKASDMSYTVFDASKSYGLISDGKNLWNMGSNKVIEVFPYFDITRRITATNATYIPNELLISDGGKYFITDWNATGKLVEFLPSAIYGNNTILSTGDIKAEGSLIGDFIVKTGGLSTQFLKADGSVDDTAYLTNLKGLLLDQTTQQIITGGGLEKDLASLIGGFNLGTGAETDDYARFNFTSKDSLMQYGGDASFTLNPEEGFNIGIGGGGAQMSLNLGQFTVTSPYTQITTDEMYFVDSGGTWFSRTKPTDVSYAGGNVVIKANLQDFSDGFFSIHDGINNRPFFGLFDFSGIGDASIPAMCLTGSYDEGAGIGDIGYFGFGFAGTSYPINFAVIGAKVQDPSGTTITDNAGGQYYFRMKGQNTSEFYDSFISSWDGVVFSSDYNTNPDRIGSASFYNRLYTTKPNIAIIKHSGQTQDLIDWFDTDGATKLASMSASGTFQANAYKSSDGTAGQSETLPLGKLPIFKNGLYVGHT